MRETGRFFHVIGVNGFLARKRGGSDIIQKIHLVLFIIRIY